MTMIELLSLTVGYGHRNLIECADCRMSAGTLTALIGRNGAGKSSLLRVIAGIDRPLSGSVMLDGRSISEMKLKERAKAMAFVNTSRVRIQNLHCRDLVAMGRAPYTDWVGKLTTDDEEIIMKSLALVGMEAYANRTMDKMSDGECQRVMIARALAQDTPIMILDEPTSFLDLPNRYELCILLANLAHNHGKCILFSTHELDIAFDLCDKMAVIDSPHLIYGNPADIGTSAAIERLFRNRHISFSVAERKIKITS